MKKTKLNPLLLEEEVKRFKLINEYSFYKESDTTLDEDDDNPTDDIANELGIDPATGEAAPPDGQLPPEPNPANAEDPSQDLPPAAAAPTEVPPMEEPESDDIELDVTELVDSTDAASNAASKAAHNTQILMKKLDDLESRLGNMDAVSAKIEELEKEIILRNPTPVEKLEMRSLNSYPYSQKLTDYWAEKEGPYDVMNTGKKEEYVLDKDAINYDYSESNIKNSFGVKEPEYDEEDI